MNFFHNKYDYIYSSDKRYKLLMITEKFTEFTQNIKQNGLTSIGSFVYKLKDIRFHCLLQKIHDENKDYLFFEKPTHKTKILAWDPIASVTHTGINRIALTEKDISKLSNDFHSNWNEFPSVSFPLFLGGIKFHPDNIIDHDFIWKDFNDSEWFIPAHLLYTEDESHYLIYNFLLGNSDQKEILEGFVNTIDFCFSIPENIDNPRIVSVNQAEENDEDYRKWELNVNKALKIITEEDAEKIVLSRRVKHELSDEPRISLILKQLSEKYPSCHTFAFRKSESVFFGASPERLASISNGWIEADALAGSSPRGQNEKEDLLLAERLLSSEKNINEQKAVVDFIAGSFRNFTDEINYPETPEIKKLPNIQHLWTPIRAKLSKSGSVFSLLKDIHPTPAICGVPWSKALSFINDSEPHNRGLYAGIIGWFNFDNEGEFVVALRSGLLKKKTIYAFAGCGIVMGSDPKLEYEESELKLQPILSLFRNGKKDKS